MDYITFDVYLYGNVTGGKDSRRHMRPDLRMYVKCFQG